MIRASLVFCLLALLTGNSALKAQYLGFIAPAGNSITLEALKPSLDTREGEKYKFGTAAFFLTGRYQISPDIRVKASVPFTRVDYHWSGYGYSESEKESGLGNPYLGIEYHPTEFLGSIEGGVALPLAQKKNAFANSIGIIADINRWEYFSVNWMPVVLMGHFGRWPAGATGPFFRGSLGASLFINTEKDKREDASETYILYGYTLGYQTKTAIFQANISGRYWASAERGNWGERSFHHVGLLAGFILGRIQSGIRITLPLDKDYQDIIDYVVGLDLAYLFPIMK